MKLNIQSSPNLSPYRSISGVSVLSRLMEARGISADRILSGSGIRSDELNHADALISPEQELAVIRNVIRLSPDPDIGLIAGQHGHVGVNGKLGMAWICCDTAFEALLMAAEYSELTLTFFQYDLKSHGRDIIVTLNEIMDCYDLLPFVCERELASVIRMCEDVTNMPFGLKEVHFTYPEPAHHSSYPYFFHCPIYFNAPELLFIVDQKYLDLPLPKSDPIMKSIYEKECRELVQKYRNQKTVKDIVIHQIKSKKGEFIDLETISSRLKMSSRTLRRKLTAEQTSYQQILDDIKKEEAVSLLVKSSISIEEISQKTGYSNTANFYHAFKKWTGRTPNEYRKIFSQKVRLSQRVDA